MLYEVINETSPPSLRPDWSVNAVPMRILSSMVRIGANHADRRFPYHPWEGGGGWKRPHKANVLTPCQARFHSNRVQVTVKNWDIGWFSGESGTRMFAIVLQSEQYLFQNILLIRLYGLLFEMKYVVAKRINNNIQLQICLFYTLPKKYV